VVVHDLQYHYFGGGRAWTWRANGATYALRLGSKGPRVVVDRSGGPPDGLWWHDERPKETLWFPGMTGCGRWTDMPWLPLEESARDTLLRFLSSVPDGVLEHLACILDAR